MKNLKIMFAACGLLLFSNLTNADQGQDVVLKHSSGGNSVPLIADTNLMDINVVCTAIGGSRAKILSEKKEKGMQWFQVKALNGNCKDKIGWVSFEHIHLAQR